MKKITLAEKIARAEARIIDTEARLTRDEDRLARFTNEQRELWLAMNDLLHQPFAEITANNKRWFWRAVERREEVACGIEVTTWLVEDEKKDLVNQKRYLRNLQNMQAKIDAEFAAEDAYIDAMITLAGAIA